jgi:hypothetical protein
MRIGRQLLENGLQLFRQPPERRQPLAVPGEFSPVRQLVVNQEIGYLLERGVLGQIVDGIAAMLSLPVFPTVLIAVSPPLQPGLYAVLIVFLLSNSSSFRS